MQNQIKPRSKQSRIDYHLVSDLFAVKFNDMRYFRNGARNGARRQSGETPKVQNAQISPKLA